MTRMGFIGLGIMGTPMAGHLAAAGYPLAIHDIDTGATARFAADHPAATVGVDAADVGRLADVVVTMLPDGEQVQRVALGPEGLAGSMAAGSLLIDCSSSQPWLTRETAAALADAGVAMIDAPVSGAQWGAEQAELVFMVGGARRATWQRARPVLDVLGRAVFHLGPLGSGHIMKCINNTITSMTFHATAEGLVLGVRAGLDPAAMNDVFNESTGGSWITRNHIEPRDPVADVRRPVPARADAQGRRHRHRARPGPRARPPVCRAWPRRMYEAADHQAGPGQQPERARALDRAHERRQDRAAGDAARIVYDPSALTDRDPTHERRPRSSGQRCWPDREHRRRRPTTPTRRSAGDPRRRVRARRPTRHRAPRPELDVSVVPVREAIRRLEAEGYVTFTRNVGATVTSDRSRPLPGDDRGRRRPRRRRPRDSPRHTSRPPTCDGPRGQRPAAPQHRQVRPDHSSRRINRRVPRDPVQRLPEPAHPQHGRRARVGAARHHPPLGVHVHPRAGGAAASRSTTQLLRHDRGRSQPGDEIERVRPRPPHEHRPPAAPAPRRQDGAGRRRRAAVGEVPRPIRRSIRGSIAPIVTPFTADRRGRSRRHPRRWSGGSSTPGRTASRSAARPASRAPRPSPSGSPPCASWPRRSPTACRSCQAPARPSSTRRSS